MATLRRMKATITFSNECVLRGSQLTPTEVEELRAFIIDALESWGGQRHPDNWLFSSLENVEVNFGKSL